ncbi:MAG: hypothetical protein WAL59_05300, partial [Roseiarcus sp.]
MKLERIEDIANALLYEGYILYPYRPSSIKNRQRWTFGGVFPQDFEAGSGDVSAMQTQVLVEGGSDATVEVHLRFLQIMRRDIGKLAAPMAVGPTTSDPEMVSVLRLEVDGKEFLGWEEAIEREVVIPELSIERLANDPRIEPFGFAGARNLEWIRASNGDCVAAMIRQSDAIDGIAAVEAVELASGLFQLIVRVENVTALPVEDRNDRSKAQWRAFASMHVIAEARGGRFVSLLDPPDGLRTAAGSCKNQGWWPVLVGEEGERDTVLSSPIILYDYPKVAPESPGDLFDGTEIDEILTLRILAMTDDEKREMASVDSRARALLERTHSLTSEDMARLHGTMREAESQRGADVFVQALHGDGRPRLASLVDGGREITVGTQVRLRPRAGGDILDIAFRDKLAIVEAIERDFEDRVHIAVTLVDDPGRDLGAAGFPGHRFYFAADEMEPLGAGELP